MEISHQ